MYKNVTHIHFEMNQLPYQLVEMILHYIVPPQIVLREGVDPKKCIKGLCNTTQCQRQSYVLPMVTRVHNVLYYIKEKIKKTCTDFILSSSTVVLVDGHWMDCYPDDDAMNYMLSFPEKRHLRYNSNPHPVIVTYLLQHPIEMTWYLFSMNPHPVAIAHLLQHIYKINWVSFCKNPSIDAVDYLLAHPENIDWITFSRHPLIYVLKPDQELHQEWMEQLRT